MESRIKIAVVGRIAEEKRKGLLEELLAGPCDRDATFCVPAYAFSDAEVNQGEIKATSEADCQK